MDLAHGSRLDREEGGREVIGNRESGRIDYLNTAAWDLIRKQKR